VSEPILDDKGERKGFVCECGEQERFPSYVFAHWLDVLNHTCEKCGRKHDIVCGLATLVEPKANRSKSKQGKPNVHPQ
jgi:hypothetical protein